MDNIYGEEFNEDINGTENESVEISVENGKNADEETKSEKFKRLASSRVNKIVAGIKNLGNLSGPAYEYSEEQVAKMFEYIREELAEAESRFSKIKKEKKSFSFDE